MNHKEQLFRIQQYIDGSLSPQQMYELERDALDDPFLQDALDGYLLKEQVNHRKLSLLQERLEERLIEQREDRSRLLFSWQRLGIAGVAGLLFVLSCVLFWMTKHLREKNADAAAQQEVVVEMNANGDLERFLVPLEITPLPDNKLTPEKGWSAFQLSLNKRLAADQALSRVIQSPLQVSFEIDQYGSPVTSALNTENPELKSFIKTVLTQDVKWRGRGPGHFEIKPTE